VTSVTGVGSSPRSTRLFSVRLTMPRWARSAFRTIRASWTCLDSFTVAGGVQCSRPERSPPGPAISPPLLRRVVIVRQSSLRRSLYSCCIGLCSVRRAIIGELRPEQTSFVAMSVIGRAGTVDGLRSRTHRLDVKLSGRATDAAFDPRTFRLGRRTVQHHHGPVQASACTPRNSRTLGSDRSRQRTRVPVQSG
jgi:hypothetical protein